MSARSRIWAAGQALALGWRAAPLLLTGYIFVAVAAAGLPVAAAWMTKAVIDAVIGGAGWGTVAWAAAGLGMAGLLLASVEHITTYLRAETDRRIALLSKERLFTAMAKFIGLARIEQPSFHDQVRLAQEAGRSAPGSVVNGLINTGRGLLTLTGFLGSLLILSPLLALAVVLAAAPLLLAELALARRRAAMFTHISPVLRREMWYTQLLLDNRAAKEIRLFGLFDFLRRRMLADLASANHSVSRVDRTELVTQGSLSLLSAAVAAGGLIWTVFAAHRGAISVGDITVFIAALAGVQAALALLVQYYALAHQALLLFQHYLDIADMEPDLPVPANAKVVPQLSHRIELRDVWFRYGPKLPWVLRGVNLTIECGKALAIVGHNGAGKSTLVKLLCRFYDPTRGAILWDGVDLRELDPGSLRQRISAVFQDFMQYDLTAAENISLGDLTSLDDRPRLAAAAQLAGVHPALIELPQGYDTMLSRTLPGDFDVPDSCGVVLSTGQWQRLALARGLLRGKRDLLILDEPSSGLDPEAEYEIHSTLRQLRTTRTSVLISHRLSTVRDADLIVVLADGEVKEAGSHAELVTDAGRYARLFSLQAKGYTGG